MEIREKCCDQCKTELIVGYRCDTCSTAMSIAPIHLSCGYGSPLDGNEYDFCDLKCLQAFIEAELKKGVI